MQFEIWVQHDDGSAVLTNPLDPIERRAIKARDFYLHTTLEAVDYESAQDGFLSWCQHRIPGVSEETVDPDVIDKQWRRMMMGVGERSGTLQA